MLHEEYGNNEPIFDLAKIESTHPDGTIESFSQDGQNYASLIKAYTNDGGHLTEAASILAANELLDVLIQVARN